MTLPPPHAPRIAKAPKRRPPKHKRVKALQKKTAHIARHGLHGVTEKKDTAPA